MFDFKENYLLENTRVRLTPLAETDFEHLVPFALSEPETWRYSLSAPDTADKMRKYISTAIESRDAGHSYAFVVFDKIKSRYAGCTRFYDIQLAHSALQLGYTWYGKDFRGTGLNKCCKFLMLQFAFEHMHMHRVEFRADSRNERSIRAMKSIGCVPEGVLRSNCSTPNGERRDSIVLSILRQEWESNVKALLAEFAK